MKRRVVVTGVGLVTPVGIGIREAWEPLLAGTSGIGPITRFDCAPYATRFAGEVRGFDPAQYIDPKEVRRMDLFIQYGMAATYIAVRDAGLEVKPETAHRIGVYVGAGLGGLSTIEEYHDVLREKGPRRISPFFIPALIANLAPGQISMRWGCRGPNMSHVSACATGAHAVGEAMRVIQHDEADAMICGGCEATITPLGVGGFNAMRALSTRNDAPQAASRPFDRDRDGFVIAEGAGVLILEEMETARRRGARIYGEIVGYGRNADAHHMTHPPDDGSGAAECMRLALRDAGVSPSEATHVNGHATSTPLGDISETRALKAVFGDAAKKLMISGTKSMTGHMLGAAGGVEAIFTVLAVYHGAVPPTINLENPDPECDLDYVPNQAREAPVEVALSNAFGFGGTNASLVVRKFRG